MSTEKHSEGPLEGEPASFTHPKPSFDDSEGPSRKRRRTASPDSIKSSTETVELQEDLVIADQQQSQPRTPSPSTPMPDEEPTSSAKLSLNLREASNSSSSPTRSEVIAGERTSLEYGAASSTRNGGKAVHDQPSSTSSSASPPSPEDDGNAQIEASGITSCPDEKLVAMAGALRDPSREFPLHDSASIVTPDSVKRVREHLRQGEICFFIASCHTETHLLLWQQKLTGNTGYSANALDHAVMVRVNEWIRRSLAYFKSANRDEVLQSIYDQYQFWLHFPAYIDLLFTLSYEEVQSQPDLLKIMEDLSVEVTRLAAHFIRFDPEIWRRFSDVRQATREDVAQPLSFRYLQCFEAICRYFPNFHDDMTPCEVYQRAVTAFGVDSLDTLDELNNLALASIELIPDRPTLASIAVYLATVMRRMVTYRGNTPRPDTDQEHMVICGALDHLWGTLNSHLRTLLPLLSPQESEDALSSLRKTLAYFDGSKESVSMYEATKPFRIGLQSLETRDSRYIHALRWFSHECLWIIRSSQMKLQNRLSAATSLGICLVGIWKTHNAAQGNEGRTAIFDPICDYLIRERIADTFLDTSCHPQLIAKSVDIVGFLVANQRFSRRDREQLWQALKTCHDQRTSGQFCKIFETYVRHMDRATMTELMQWFQETPIQDWTAGMHDSCRLTIERVLLDSNFSWAQHPYDLCLWLLRQSYSPRVTPFSRQRISEFAVVDIERLWARESTEMRQRRKAEIAATCMADLASGSDTRLGSLQALAMMLRDENEIDSLLDVDQLLRLVIVDLRRAGAGSSSATSTEPRLSGTLNAPRRRVIGKIIELTSAKLDNEQWHAIWTILVGAQTVCQADREAGWAIIDESINEKKASGAHLTRFADLLSKLQPDWYCDGLLQFLKKQISPVLATDIDPEIFHSGHVAVGVEQLWRILMTTQDDVLAAKTAQVLAFDIYLDSPGIRALPVDRVHAIHDVVLTRCLEQIHGSAPRFDGPHSTERTEPSHPRLFSRSLQLLQIFITHSQQNIQSRLPDIRCYMYRDAPEPCGNPTSLFYQAFEEGHCGDVQDLALGESNTIADLLTKLGKATGFANCRVFFRGRLIPSEKDSVHMTLREAGIVEGLCLVKWAEPLGSVETRVKHGSSFIEVEVSRWFDKLLPILDLTEKEAGMIYDLLVKLPADQEVIRSLTTGEPDADILLPLDRPFRSLYALYALEEYLRDAKLGFKPEVNSQGMDHNMHGSLVCLRLISIALSSRSSKATWNAWDADVLRILLVTYQQLLSDEECIVTTHPHVCSIPNLVGIFGQVLVNWEDSKSEAALGAVVSTIMVQGHHLPGTWKELKQHHMFCDRMRVVMVQNPSQGIRTLATDCLSTAISRDARIHPSTGPSYSLIDLVWCLLSQCLPDLRRFPEHSSEATKLCRAVLSAMKAHYPIETRPAISQVASAAALALTTHTTTEDYMHPSHIDIFCKNMTSLLNFCLQDDDCLVKSGELQNRRLASAIFSKLLFSSSPVLTAGSRIMLYNVLLALASRDCGVRESILQELNDALSYSPEEQMPYCEEFRTLTFDRENNIRTRGGHVGLYNPSNVCYLNSLVQQLFMNRDFRRFILSLPSYSLKRDSNMFAALQRLLSYMQNSWEHHIEHEEFLSAITIDGEPLNIHVQMDVDEFYNVLLDKLEGDIAGSLKRSQLRAFFSGQLIQQIKSKECCHISERVEPFMTIQCDVSGKRNLTESLRAYVEGEVMDGENSYKCESCDTHVAAVKRTCLKTVPDHLTLSLKRFEYDLSTLQRYKINSRFEFPESIDMAPYTIDALGNNGVDVKNDMFDLVGILVHAGTAETGHYYSFIRERSSFATESQWFEFNDKNVNAWDPVNIPDMTFGGEKSYSAYMLFYQRRTSLRPESTRDQASASITDVSVDPEIGDRIIQDNRLLLRRHCFYEDAYAQFVWAICQLDLGLEDASQSQSGTSLAWRVVLSHFDQVICRAKERPLFAKYRALLLAALTGPHKARYKSDFVTYFEDRPEAFRWLLMRNPEASIRAFTGDLMILCLKPEETAILASNDPSASTTDTENSGDKGDLSRMTSIMRRLWQSFHSGTRAWEEVFYFIQQFAQLSSAHANLLLKDDWLANLLCMVIRDATAETADMFKGMLRNLAARADRPPAWRSVLELLSYLLDQMEPKISAETIVDSVEERQFSQDGRFSWTADEVNLVLRPKSKAGDGLFAVKLIEMDVNCAATGKIIGRLIAASDEAEQAVLGALLRNIDTDVDVESIRPFLRAATSYIRYSVNESGLKKLHHCMADYASKIRSGNVEEYLEFFEAFLGLIDDSYYLYQFCFERLPTWAPVLLACYDSSVRQEVQAFLCGHVFDAIRESQPEDLEGCHLTVIAPLGWACVEYLREYHLNQDWPISVGMARDVLWIVAKCEEISNDPDLHLDSSSDLTEARKDLERKLVIRVEQDMSAEDNGWPLSDGSSDEEDLIA